jgi:Abortive infection C-terminus
LAAEAYPFANVCLEMVRSPPPMVETVSMDRPDFWLEHQTDSPWGPESKQRLNTELVESLRAEPLPDTSDVTAAEALLELVWDELQAFGTGGGNSCDDKEIAIAIQALEAVTRRLGIPIELPFRNFTKFRTYWLRNDGYGSWQARRDMLEGLFEPTRKQLSTLESRLAGPKIKEEDISPLRNPAAIREHLSRLQRVSQSDPPLAIGTAKELIESTAKTVLQERGLKVDDRDDLPTLVKRAQEAVGLHPSTTKPGPDGTDAVKRILGGLTTIALGLGELRNRGYGTGHGPRGERIGLRPRHARLAVNAAMTWCSVMLDTLSDLDAPWQAGSQEGE